MKVITIGNGFVASHFKYEIIKERLQPNNNQIRYILDKYKPDTVINTIGFCGNPNIDQCEIEKERTVLTNITIPTILATECKKLDIHLISINSGCIFYGQSPNIVNDVDIGWKETDYAAPQSFYSKSKYAVDLATGYLPNCCNLRIRMPISNKNSPRNIINKLLNFKSVIYTLNSMTFLSDLEKLVDWVIENKKTGIYHATNPQPLSHIRILEEYVKYNPEHSYDVISEKDLYKFVSAPRSNCILNTDKLNSEGFNFTNSFEALKKCMSEFIANKNPQLT